MSSLLCTLTPFVTLFFPEPVSHLEIRNGQPPDEGKVSFSFDKIPLSGQAGGKGLDTRLQNCLSRISTLEIVLNGQELTSTETMTLSSLVENLNSLRSITLSPTGVPEQALLSSILRLRETSARKNKLNFVVNFTLDTQADAFATLSSRKVTSLTPVLEISRKLQQNGVTVRWMVPILRALVYRLEAIFSLALDEGFDLVLIPGPNTHSRIDAPLGSLSPGKNQFLWDFISYRLLTEENQSLTPKRFAYYQSLCASLGRRHPSAPVKSKSCSVMVLHIHSHSDQNKWTLARENRPAFGHQSEDPPVHPWWRPMKRATLQSVEVGGVLLEGIHGLLQWVAAKANSLLQRRSYPKTTPIISPRLLLIGAYGGEHIGDMAILGGVLLRFHRDYGSTHAVLMSQRPAHTRYLIAMLDVPVDVVVEAYTAANVRKHLPSTDTVVFAGGPLIDLPKQLVKHLYTVSLAKRLDKPFIAEGIGPGAFVRWPSAWTAQRIVRMAKRITVRTSADAQFPLLRGLDLGIGRDPAFDYLETRRVKLTRLPPQDRRWIDALTQNTDERLLVGINIRPIYDLFTVGMPTRKRAEHTRFVEARFEARLAEGLLQFQRSWDKPLSIIFFPMNSIQFGLSDLRSAYRIACLVNGNIDLRVWEADPSIDGIVALLRKIDIAITMRFHATIFALAQQRRVIGIDYRVGQSGKVAALLKDFKQSDNCCRIDEMEADWLSQHLATHAASCIKESN